MPKRKRKEEDGGSKSKKDVKYKGVCKRRERFQSQIRIDGTLHNLGMFDTSKEAAQAYDQAVIQAGRPTATVNFPDQVPKNYEPKKKKLAPNNTTGENNFFFFFYDLIYNPFEHTF